MKTARRVLAALAVLSLLVIGGCSLTDRHGDSFRFPIAADPKQLDPQMATDAASLEVLHAVMDGLTRLSSPTEVAPAVAVRWVSEAGGTRWVFTLREDACWADGTTLTADDFVYAWERAVDPATASPLADRFDNLCSAVADNPHTLTVTLNAPDPSFPLRVAEAAFFPCQRAFFEQTAGRYGMDAAFVPSNGAFRVTAWEHHSYVIIRKNENYYAADEILPEAVRFVIGETEDPAVSLDEGYLDAAEFPDVAAAATARYRKTCADSIHALWMNTSVDALTDQSVRRALRDTVNWSLLHEQDAAYPAAPLTQLVPGDATFLQGAFAPARAPYTPTETADRLKSAKLPKLTLLCEDTPEEIRAAQIILQSWQKNANLYFALTPLPADQLTARLQIGNYELALASVAGKSSDAREILLSFVTENPQGTARLQDPALEAQIRAATTEAELAACEAALAKLCPCVPLRPVGRTYGWNADGLVIHPFSGHPYEYVYDFRQAVKPK